MKFFRLSPEAGRVETATGRGVIALAQPFVNRKVTGVSQCSVNRIALGLINQDWDLESPTQLDQVPGQVMSLIQSQVRMIPPGTTPEWEVMI